MVGGQEEKQKGETEEEKGREETEGSKREGRDGGERLLMPPQNRHVVILMSVATLILC